MAKKTIEGAFFSRKITHLIAKGHVKTLSNM